MPTIYRDLPDLESLERAYSPSRWVASLDAILLDYAERSAKVRAGWPGLRSLSYGDAPEESLDFFPAGPGTEPRPVVVYIHGGYWQRLGKSDHSFPAPGFAAQGVHYAAVNYGLAPAATLAQMVERCRRALLALHAQADALGIDARQIHLAGCSAGGHLAAMTALAALPAPLASLTLLSGVFDLRPLVPTYINRAVGLTEDEALLLSPLLRIDTTGAAWPPTLVAVAEHEPDEFKRQASELAEALARRGVPVERHEFADRNHFDLVFDLGERTTPLGGRLAARIEATRAGGWRASPA